MYKVQFKNVTKKYKMYNKPSEKLKDLFSRKETGEYHYALSNISFEVDEGEIVGIIGLNGSGKSTLSNLIAGVTLPNKGHIDIKGTAALIAISSGLNPQLTGLENIELKGLMMGLTKEQIKNITPKIIEFAEIGKFINQPVKTYSSGMKARLGFAISVNIDPDVLVIDEALSVGDQSFADKCLEKMQEFKEKGKTIFFISHSLAQVRKFCTKALWLHYGQLKEFGDLQEVAANYKAFVDEYRKLTPQEKERMREEYQLQAQQQESPSDSAEPRRRKRKKRAAIKGVSILAVAAGATALLQYKDGMEKQEKAKAIQTAAEQQTAGENQDGAEKTSGLARFAVNGSEVLIRQKPSTEAARLDAATFGDVFVVTAQEKDSENGTWSQITTASGQTGWISSQFLTELSLPPLPDEQLSGLDSKFRSQFGAAPLQFTSYLGNTWDEMKAKYRGKLSGLKPTTKGQQVASSDNVQFIVADQAVKEVHFIDASFTLAELKQQLGEPSLINRNAYFYETASHYVTAKPGENSDSLQLVITKK